MIEFDRDDSRFRRFGPSRWIGAGRSRMQSLILAEERRAIRRQLRESCPEVPGVYGMIDRSGELIYVGKAKSLRARLLSYFAAGTDDQKSIRIGGRAVRLVWERVSHEFAALVRELELIRRFRPRCNVQGQPGRLRRGFLCVGRAPAPRVFLSATTPASAERCYGPLLIGRRMRRAVERLNTVFGLRDCADDTPMQFADQSLLIEASGTALCPRHEFGLCLGPCAGLCNRRQYYDAVRGAVAFIEGRSQEILETLEADMRQAAADRRFERASLLRDTVRDLTMVQRQVTHIMAVREWAFVYSPPAPSNRQTWYLIRHGMPVAAVPRPRTIEQAQHVQTLVDKWLVNTDGPGPSIDRESLPYVVFVARWFHFRPEERSHTLSASAALEYCQARITGNQVGRQQA